MLNKEEVRKSMPPGLRGSITDSFIDMLNNIPGDQELAENIRNNFMSYTKVLSDGKFKTEDYLKAVMYVSFKLMGYSNKESYAKTFPTRYQALVAKGTSDKDISAYVAAYSKGKLIGLLLEQSMIPTWVLNQDMFQKALNTQYLLMTGAKSEMVRFQAANSLLTHLKPPEKKEMNINIGVAESDGLKELKSAMTQLAKTQIEAIGEGQSAKSIAHSKLIIDAEVVEQEDDE